MDTIGDARVGWRWLMVRKIVAKIIEKYMILEGKRCWEAGVDTLIANPLRGGIIFILHQGAHDCEIVLQWTRFWYS
jgi:hypothetical protein